MDPVTAGKPSSAGKHHPIVTQQASAEGGEEDGDVDIESEVAAAMDSLPRPATHEVTDADVVVALLEEGAVAREALLQALAAEDGDTAPADAEEAA